MIRSALLRVGDAVRDRPVWAAAAVVVVLGGLAAWRALVADGPPRLPDATWKLDEACEHPGQAYPDAAPHDGPPPHPVAVFPQSHHEDDDALTWQPDDPADVQLVACLERLGPDPSADHAALGATALECEYSPLGMAPPGSGRAVPLVAARYRLTVHELRTGRRLASEELVGDRFDCPSAIGEDDREVYSTVELDQLHALLDPYVQGTGS